MRLSLGNEGTGVQVRTVSLALQVGMVIMLFPVRFVKNADEFVFIDVLNVKTT